MKNDDDRPPLRVHAPGEDAASPTWYIQVGDLVRPRRNPFELWRVDEIDDESRPPRALCRSPGDVAKAMPGRWLPLDSLGRHVPPK